MRVRLSDGTYLDVRPSTPSKAVVKRSAGTLKRYRHKSSLPVVGSRNVTAATYSDFEVDPDDPSIVVINRSFPTQLATTINPRKATFTWDLGGSASTGYIGGRGV